MDADTPDQGVKIARRNTPTEWTPDLTGAVHAYLARSDPLLLVLQLTDLLGAKGQANLPGTTTQYPNWRGRNELSLEDLVRDRSVADALAAVVRERGSSTGQMP